MLKQRYAIRRLLARLVLVGLVLRIAVPAGFMPTNLDDGWFLKLCPDGMPASVMMALLGHDHHNQGDDAESYQQCDLGGGMADANSPSTSEQLTPACLSNVAQAIPAQNFVLARTASAFRARAPPHSRQHQNT